jgi:hypothetical protein
MNVAGNQLVRSSGPVDEGLSLVLPHVVLGVTPEGLFVVHSKCRRMCGVRLAHQSCCIAPAPPPAFAWVGEKRRCGEAA